MSILSIAPMIQWTDRYYRYLMRQMTSHTLLYTEMTMDNAITYNRDNLEPFIGHTDTEYPLAIQLGGYDPINLAEAAYICESYGIFNEINLNCGCPSKNAKRAGFGAELMLDSHHTGNIVREITRRVSHTQVSIKCRLGVSGKESKDDLIDFIRSVSDAGAKKIILHARVCVLNGLSPAQNRTVPPLNYELAASMINIFPEVKFILNGGISTFSEANNHLNTFHGIMIGRAAYNNPTMFSKADEIFYNNQSISKKTRREIIENYVDYAQLRQEQDCFGSGTPNLCKPLHNFFNDCEKSIVRSYKQTLDSVLKDNLKNKLEFEDLIWKVVEDTIPTDILDVPI